MQVLKLFATMGPEAALYLVAADFPWDTALRPLGKRH